MAIDLIPLAAFVLVTTFTPGPNNISSAAMGLAYGYRATLRYLAGIAMGFFLVMLACAFLSSTLLTLMPVAEQYVRWIGALYILWLAVGVLRSDYAFSKARETTNPVSKGFLLQLLNPKVFVYGLTLFSTFLSSITGEIPSLLVFALVFASIAFAATSIWAIGGSLIRNKLKNDPFRKAVNIILALLLVYTAVDLSGIISSR